MSVNNSSSSTNVGDLSGLSQSSKCHPSIGKTKRPSVLRLATTSPKFNASTRQLTDRSTVSVHNDSNSILEKVNEGLRRFDQNNQDMQPDVSAELAKLKAGGMHPDASSSILADLAEFERPQDYDVPMSTLLPPEGDGEWDGVSSWPTFRTSGGVSWPNQEERTGSMSDQDKTLNSASQSQNVASSNIDGDEAKIPREELRRLCNECKGIVQQILSLLVKICRDGHLSNVEKLKGFSGKLHDRCEEFGKKFKENINTFKEKIGSRINDIKARAQERKERFQGLKNDRARGREEHTSLSEPLLGEDQEFYGDPNLAQQATNNDLDSSGLLTGDDVQISDNETKNNAHKKSPNIFKRLNEYFKNNKARGREEHTSLSEPLLGKSQEFYGDPNLAQPATNKDLASSGPLTSDVPGDGGKLKEFGGVIKNAIQNIQTRHQNNQEIRNEKRAEAKEQKVIKQEIKKEKKAEAKEQKVINQEIRNEKKAEAKEQKVIIAENDKIYRQNNQEIKAEAKEQKVIKQEIKKEKKAEAKEQRVITNLEAKLARVYATEKKIQDKIDALLNRNAGRIQTPADSDIGVDIAHVAPEPIEQAVVNPAAEQGEQRITELREEAAQMANRMGQGLDAVREVARQGLQDIQAIRNQQAQAIRNQQGPARNE